MTDWAAEAVTRGDLLLVVLVLMLQTWKIMRAVERLAQIRDRLPKDNPVRIACSKCGTVDCEMIHAECSSCWYDRPA